MQVQKGKQLLRTWTISSLPAGTKDSLCFSITVKKVSNDAAVGAAALGGCLHRLAPPAACLTQPPLHAAAAYRSDKALHERASSQPEDVHTPGSSSLPTSLTRCCCCAACWLVCQLYSSLHCTRPVCAIRALPHIFHATALPHTSHALLIAAGGYGVVVDV